MRTFESRLLTFFILFILVMQVVGFDQIHQAFESKARMAIDTKLAKNEREIVRFLDKYKLQQLEKTAQLTSHEGLLTAILKNDISMQERILASQCQAIAATICVIVDKNNRIQAESTHQLSAQIQAVNLAFLADFKLRNHVTNVAINNHVLQQFVALPIANQVDGRWLVAVFPFGEQFVEQIDKKLILSFSIVAKDRQYWQVMYANFNANDAEAMVKNLTFSLDAGSKKLQFNDEEHSLQFIALQHQTPCEVFIVIGDSITATAAIYTRAQLIIMALTFISLLIAVVGGIYFRMSVSSPLRHLSDVAKRLGLGDYAVPIKLEGDKEIKLLASAFVTMRDGIAEREAEITRLAYWDILTDLPNRAQFKQMVIEAITATNPDSQSCYVLMLDLARFKHVNDVMGHSFGDAILKKMAQRLRNALPNATLARLGGDEFAMLLPNANLSAAQEAAQTILSLLEHPINLDDQAVDIGAGIGLAAYPDDAFDAETLVSQAEVAMYAAKNSIGNTYLVYCPQFDNSSQENLSLLGELKTAIKQNQLRLYVQPKINLCNQHVIGVEALVRWAHPTRGFLLPDQFIPFAEKTGVIRLITRWILNQSAALCSQLVANNVQLKVSVNISTHDLLDPDLPVKFADILIKHRVQTASFCLEITESAIMLDPVRAQTTLERLHAMGVELAIDDFGTGYSSLAYLKRLPVNELKIDKSFVIDMNTSDDDRIIVKSTIDLGHNMGLRVVAEGVEDAAVLSLLKGMNCDKAQGNFIKEAMPAEQLLTWLQEYEQILANIDK